MPYATEKGKEITIHLTQIGGTLFHISLLYLTITEYLKLGNFVNKSGLWYFYSLGHLRMRGYMAKAFLLVEIQSGLG